MDVYFIRHGETDFNVRHLHQPSDTPLTDHGKEQARQAKPAVQKINPTHVITSTFTRAAETAAIATEGLSVETEPNVLFVELVRPKNIIGKSHYSLRTIWYILRWFFSKDEAFWKETGGESRLAFLSRIYEAKHYLEKLPNDARVVVFSHSVFINFFVAHICDEKPIATWEAVLLLLKIKTLKNSSVTHVTYDATLPDNTCKWNVLKFEEDPHTAT